MIDPPPAPYQTACKHLYVDSGELNKGVFVKPRQELASDQLVTTKHTIIQNDLS